MPLIDPETSERGAPVWQLAKLFPPQGSWTETDYLTLDAGRLMEFDHGCVEVLEMPTKEHQRTVQAIYRLLFAHVQSTAVGEIFVAPLPVRLWDQKFREPDVVFVAAQRGEYEGYPDGADLVMEVLSDDATSRRRDTIVKVEDYAKAGIPEYWMIDLAERQISVGVLRSGEYEFIQYSAGQQAESSVLKSFNVPVTQLFDGIV
jgi:Uma2 family endonuclease